MRVGRPGRCLDFLQSCGGPSIGDVLGDAGLEQNRLLEHHTDFRTQRGKSPVSDVVPVDQDVASCRVVEAWDQRNQRSFSAARRPHDGRHLLGRDLQIDALEHWLRRLVLKAHVGELNQALEPGRRASAGTVGDPLLDH